MATDALSTTFAALADPTRRAILARLATGEATVNELAAPFDVSVQAVSQHLKVLERAGLITRGRTAQFRPCRFEGAPLDTATSWIDRYRHVWQDRFDALGQHLLDLQQPARPAGPASGAPADPGTPADPDDSSPRPTTVLTTHPPEERHDHHDTRPR